MPLCSRKLLGALRFAQPTAYRTPTSRAELACEARAQGARNPMKRPPAPPASPLQCTCCRGTSGRENPLRSRLPVNKAMSENMRLPSQTGIFLIFTGTFSTAATSSIISVRANVSGPGDFKCFVYGPRIVQSLQKCFGKILRVQGLHTECALADNRKAAGSFNAGCKLFSKINKVSRWPEYGVVNTRLHASSARHSTWPQARWQAHLCQRQGR